MSKPDQFDSHYQRSRERKRAEKAGVDPDEPLPEEPVEPARRTDQPGRNDPCPCGSGQKYKKCCGKS